MITKQLVILSLVLTTHVYAGSATWNLNPTSGDWNTATNWTGKAKRGRRLRPFGASNLTDVSVSASDRGQCHQLHLRGCSFREHSAGWYFPDHQRRRHYKQLRGDAGSYRG